MKQKREVKADNSQNATWLDTEEAAAYLRTTPAALRNAIYRGSVPYYKFQRRLRFKKTELDRLLESTRMGGYR